jgi:spore germination protein
MQLLRNNPFLVNRNVYPGEVIIISYNTIGKITTNGYAYPFIDINILKKTLPSLTYISIYNYRATSEGEIITHFDDFDVLKVTKEYGTIPLLMLTTLSPLGELDLEVAYSILLNEDYQKSMIEQMLSIIKSKGYYGIKI